MTGETRKIRRGRGHSYRLDGAPTLGVTTILAEGFPKPGLKIGAVRETADFVTVHWPELGELDPAKRLREIERRGLEGWNAATARGTEVHTYAARLLAGEQVDVPDDYVDVVDACLSFLADWNVDELEVERTIVNREWRYMGTFDLLARIGGQIVLVDWKTGKSGVWPEAALQLCAYARAEQILDDETGAESPMPPVERALAVHLRADGYDVIECDIGERTFDTFLWCKGIAEWTADARDVVLSPATPPELERAR